MQEETIKTTTMQNAGPPPSRSPQPPTFSATLNKRLDELGWTAADLARRTGQPYSTVLSWTKGALDEALARIPSLAKELGLTSGALLGDRPPVPEIGANQVLVTVGEYLIDPRAYEIVKDGGSLPPGQAWHAKIAAGSYAASQKRYDELRKGLPNKKGRRR